MERNERGSGSGRHVFGVLLLLAVVFIWVGGSELMQHVFLEESFSKPFFLTYCSTGTLSFYLLIPGFRWLWGWFFTCWSSSTRRSSKRNQDPEELEELTKESSRTQDESEEVGIDLSTLRSTSDDQEIQMNDNRALGTSSSEVLNSGNGKLSPMQVAFLSLQFCLLWFFANYSTNAALIYTSVSSSTILNSTSGFFTLLLGAFAGVETITFSRLLAVMICLLGVILVSLADGNGGGQDSVFGDLISVFGAFMYGCYTIFLKKKIGHEDHVDMQLFFGFVGLFNLVLLWPFFVFFNSLGIEIFEWPSQKVAVMLLINGLIGTCLSDYLWLLAMLMTSPLVVTLGLSLTIPLAMGADSFQGKFQSTPGYWIGTIMVLLGFIAINSGKLFAKIDETISSAWNVFVQKLPFRRKN